MSGGTISNNTASSYGGGVNLWQSTFIMSGNSVISGNTATSGGGGGVSMSNSSTFTMKGGTISGNKGAYVGGGVYTRWDSDFRKTGGTIYGYDAGDAVNSNAAVDGGYPTGIGHAVYVDNSPLKKRDSTAGPGVNLNSGASDNWE
jgi:parallel beta-helix repeat protein